jgi:hypothetical protein
VGPKCYGINDFTISIKKICIMTIPYGFNLKMVEFETSSLACLLGAYKSHRTYFWGPYGT